MWKCIQNAANELVRLLAFGLQHQTFTWQMEIVSIKFVNYVDIDDADTSL